MTVRLTKHDREQMARALARHKLDSEAKALCAESAGLFADVYADQHDAALRRAMKAFLKLRPKGLPHKTNANINARGRSFWIGDSQTGHSGIWWNADVTALPVPDDASYRYAYADGELAERLIDFSDRIGAFPAKVHEAYRKALSALNQFSTGEKLSKDWPEALPVIGELIPTASRALPVVQMEAINDEFGLPPGDERLAA